MAQLWGYMGKVLRVDLTTGTTWDEPLEAALAEESLGGTGVGVDYLYREVPPGVAWDDPANRIIMASGPVGGTPLAGGGTFSLVTKGPMTNLGVSTQANGYWAAFIKLAGYDAVILQGRSPDWAYLHIAEDRVELRDARPLLGKDTWEMEEAIRADLATRQRLSVFGIGPAGEHGVRFATVAGDRGHVCSKNGCGAVMGGKRLKAIAVSRGRHAVPIYDTARLREMAKALLEDAKAAKGGQLYKWGTGGSFSGYALTGGLPTRNYSTNTFPEHEQMNGQYLRTHFAHRAKPCWACGLVHTKYTTVTEGPYTGYQGEEPEYEALAAWGPVIGNTDPGAVVMLSDVADRLGLDVNEAGWVVAWAMECYEKGLLRAGDLDGLELRWGNVEAARTLLGKISRREGVGDLLAEGVMRASRQVGPEAAQLGVYVLKGATPRGHDHRAIWAEMLDTCVSATGTIQAGARMIASACFGLPPATNPFSPWEVAAQNAKLEGWMVFLDSLPICRFISINAELTMACVNAITGRQLGPDDALRIGRRVINQLRVFNFRHGLDPALEAPSARYGSTPTDGAAKGKSIAPYLPWMKSFYFELMGWEPATGKPLPATLRALGLERLIPDLPA
jgi:aldehyde:ferredoxin oxidoreductase